MDSIAGALKCMFWSVRNSIAAVIGSSLAENTSYELVARLQQMLVTRHVFSSPLQSW